VINAADNESVDAKYMRRALELAQRGRFTTTPNPCVGCVIVRDNKIIGEGWHQKAGSAHAEINAIENAGGESAVSGATIYLTLEPCHHFGRTPPCVDTLIRAQVERVVVAMVDPNPQVAGKSLEKLRAAGIATQIGLLEAEARELNRGFLSRMEKNRPFVLLKSAMSLDGRTAMASGESKWITGEAARTDVQRLRAASCAIITGIGTVLADNPSLTVRSELLGDELPEGFSRQPLRVILDSQLRIPLDTKILHELGEVIVVCGELNVALIDKAEQLVNRGVAVVSLPNAAGKIDLPSVLFLLAQREINQVMIEAGSQLSAAFVAQNLVDEWVIYLAPTLLGASAKPLVDFSIQAMRDQRRLKIQSIQPVGEDWKITAQLLQSK
jgi:diaminohydroxyphosphoribosylaminopyrimidine deaminase/5-amino-6-(5-phosphoribosylamino)uracil reductase